MATNNTACKGLTGDATVEPGAGQAASGKREAAPAEGARRGRPWASRLLRRTFFTIVILVAVVTTLGLYAVFGERYWITVNHYHVAVPNLPEAMRGFRIAQIADVHYGRLMPAWCVRRAVALANRQEADLIVCTGDYGHQKKSTRDLDAVWPLLKPLRAPCGVYAILGNHDHWADAACTRRWIDAYGWTLEHRVVPITKSGATFWLLAAGDKWEDDEPLDPLLEQVPAGQCRIVLAHNPDTADNAFTNRVDLFICGHTHGGQVRLPWLGAPILPVRNKAYGSGLCLSRCGTPVFVCRGLGWAILPIRFNCRPEVAVLELEPTGPGLARP